MKYDIHFGVPYLHALPEGWKLIEEPNEFTLAKSPDGKLWFVGELYAYPCRNGEVDLEGEILLSDVKL